MGSRRDSGATPLARLLRRHAGQVPTIVATAGGSNVRGFGSVATGTDHPGSDVDLPFTMGPPLSLNQVGRLENEISTLLGVPVDLVPDSALRPELRDRVISDTVAL